MIDQVTQLLFLITAVCGGNKKKATEETKRRKHRSLFLDSSFISSSSRNLLSFYTHTGEKGWTLRCNGQMSTLLLFFLLLFCTSTACWSFNHTVEITNANEKLGLQLSSGLEILSVHRQTVGLRSGDRIVGINGVPLSDSERNVKFFTSAIAKIAFPYTIQFEFAAASVPRKVISQRSPDDDRMHISELIVRTRDTTLSMNSTMSEESRQDLKVFSCAPRLLVVAHPLTACGAIKGVNGAINNSYVLVSRGVCPFEAKLSSALLSGAAGIVVVNSEDSAFAIPLDGASKRRSLTRREPMVMVMVSKRDGDALVSLLLQGAGGLMGDVSESVIAGKRRSATSVAAMATLAPRDSCVPSKGAPAAAAAAAAALQRNSALHSSRGRRQHSSVAGSSRQQAVGADTQEKEVNAATSDPSLQVSPSQCNTPLPQVTHIALVAGGGQPPQVCRGVRQDSPGKGGVPGHVQKQAQAGPCYEAVGGDSRVSRLVTIAYTPYNDSSSLCWNY